MRIEFINGATVHELWGDLTDGTLVAAFQYYDQAKSWAERAMERQPSAVSLLVVDHGTGATTRYIHKPKSGTES